MQYIDRVVDVPVSEEPGEAEDSGHSVQNVTVMRKRSLTFILDGAVTIAVHTHTTENLVDETDPTECEFADSDTRYGWNPLTMLSGTAFHRPISQTHANRPITKD